MTKKRYLTNISEDFNESGFLFRLDSDIVFTGHVEEFIELVKDSWVTNPGVIRLAAQIPQIDILFEIVENRVEGPFTDILSVIKKDILTIHHDIDGFYVNTLY